jgi:hypothetical protein
LVDAHYATGNPLLLLAVPAGIIVCGAAQGVAEALRVGLHTKLSAEWESSRRTNGADDAYSTPPSSRLQREQRS